MPNGEGGYQRGMSADTIEQVKGLVADALKISKTWAIFISAVALASAFDLSHPAGGDAVLSFQISATTVLLLSLIWLPSLVRVIAMTGMKFKTPAGEAATPGLFDLFRDLSPETKREALPPVIAAFDMVAAEQPQERVAAREARDDLEGQLAAAEPRADGSTDILQHRGVEYEQLRDNLDPGPERTFQMNSLLAGARAVAKASPLSSEDVHGFFASERQGLRMMAIASLQASPDPSAFDVLLDAISNSRSAFEQYHALAAARDHVPFMDKVQRETLTDALTRQLEDPAKGIREDGSRYREVQGLLSEL